MGIVTTDHDKGQGFSELDMTRQTKLREGLPELPARMRSLPISEKGYPIPWFVAEVDGKRDFRMADARKRVMAVKRRLCWLCGQPLGKFMAFVIGPMCAVNRNTSEPPCHRECAVFAATGCPFLTLPKAQYRDASLPEDARNLPHGLPGNPGACCIWVTHSYKPYRVPDQPKDWLISLGDPVETLWYCEGRPATRQEILDSINGRIHHLRDAARQEGPEAEAALDRYIERTMVLLPA